MIKFDLLSQREKTIFVLVAVMLAVLMIDGMARVYRQNQQAGQISTDKLRGRLDNTYAVLNRAPEIEARYSSLQANYPKLFETSDTTGLMSDLDSLAKAANVRVDMIRPLSGDKSGRLELSFQGTWPQVMQFIRQAEGPSCMFSFPVLSVQRQDHTGLILVSAQAERINLLK